MTEIKKRPLKRTTRRQEMIDRAKRYGITNPNAMTTESLYQALLSHEDLEGAYSSSEGSSNLFRNRIVDRIDDGSLDDFLIDIVEHIKDRRDWLRGTGRNPNWRTTSGDTVSVVPMSKTRTRPE